MRNFIMHSAITRRLVVILSVCSITSCGVTNTPDNLQLETVTVGPKDEIAPFSGENILPLRGVATDAKQRFIWSPRIPVRTIAWREGQLQADFERRAIVCAEPSPDALSAIAATLDAQLSGSVNDPTNLSAEARASLSRSLAETVQTIGERTETIQLLRDAFYRACESYANGAIDDFGYSLILGQIDLFMIQLLAVDALGRTRGNSEVTGALTTRDGEMATVGRLQVELQQIQRELTAVEQRATTITEIARRRSDLKATNSALTTEDTRLMGIENTLAGSSSTTGSVLESEGALSAALAPPPDNDDGTSTTLSAQELELRTLQAAELRTTRDNRRSELVATRARRTEIDNELQRNRATLAGLPEDETPPSTDGIMSRLTEKRGELEAAQNELSNAEVALAVAREGVGPGFSAAQALREIIDRTFKETGNVGAGRASQSACIQWFARNPQIKIEQAANGDRSAAIGTLKTSDGSGVPAIALFCSNLLNLGYQNSANQIAKIAQQPFNRSAGLPTTVPTLPSSAAIPASPNVVQTPIQQSQSLPAVPFTIVPEAITVTTPASNYTSPIARGKQ